MIRHFLVADAPGLVARAAEWASTPGPAPTPRHASTVMCLREASGGLEVFMLHRMATMAFAPSMRVFPGGGVDPRDDAPDLPWAGPPPAEWAARMTTDEPSARRFIVAAVREVFEETGVLLAGRAEASTALADASDPAWATARNDLVERHISLAEFLVAQGLSLRSDLMSYRAHWTTPEFEKRRYDTRFFACLLPEGQAADALTSEAQAADWARPADLLDAAATGRALMLPPTIVCLEQLAAAPSAEAFLAELPPVHEVIPVLVDTPEGLTLRADLP
ncbi:MAG: NUDIX hydrolase [Nostocoides sp.]